MLPRKEKLEIQVENYIKELIRCGTLRPGDRLKTVRELSHELKVSHVTASKAVKKLSEEGILEAKTGIGTTVSPALPALLKSGKETRLERVSNLYFFRDRDLGRDEVILFHIREKASRRGWNVVFDFFSNEKYAEVANDPDAIGVILPVLNCSRPAAKLNVPTVSFGMHPQFFPCVTPNYYETALSAVQQMLDSGYQKFYFIDVAGPETSRTNSNLLGFREIRMGFRMAFELRHLPIPETLPWNISMNITGEVENMLRGNRRNSPARPFVLFVAHGGMASEIRVMLHAFDFEIRRDVEIVSFLYSNSDELNRNSFIYDYSREGMADQLLCMIDGVYHGIEIPSRIQIPMHLVSGSEEPST